MKITQKLSIIAVTGLLSVSLAACGSDSDDNVTPTDSGTSSSSTPTPSDEETDSMDEGMDETETPMAEPASGPFGPGCAAVPMDGKGSFEGMGQDPVATAASNNPLLSTLVTAVGEADLVDTLNSAEAITVFAPTNDAFGKIPAKDLNGVLADKELLTTILTHHVVAGKIAPEDLAGEHKTLAGDTIMVKGSGEEFTVGAEMANVICGNVQTANATVYIIDSVLMPAS